MDETLSPEPLFSAFLCLPHFIPTELCFTNHQAYISMLGRLLFIVSGMSSTHPPCLLTLLSFQHSFSVNLPVPLGGGRLSFVVPPICIIIAFLVFALMDCELLKDVDYLLLTCVHSCTLQHLVCSVGAQ